MDSQNMLSTFLFKLSTFSLSLCLHVSFFFSLIPRLSHSHSIYLSISLAVSQKSLILSSTHFLFIFLYHSISHCLLILFVTPSLTVCLSLLLPLTVCLNFSHDLSQFNSLYPQQSLPCLSQVTYNYSGY